MHSIRHHRYSLVLSVLGLALTPAVTAQSNQQTSTPVTGGGTTHYVPVWTGASTLGNSVIWAKNGMVGIHNILPAYTLDVTGTIHGTTANTAGTGLRADASATTGSSATAVAGESSGDSGTGVRGDALSPTGSTFGVVGSTASPNGSGVTGYANSATGYNNAVYGANSSSNGIGVRGDVLSTSASNYTAGVVGTDNDPIGIGTEGYEGATTGSPTGVLGIVFASGGTAGLFDNTVGGNILIGSVSGTNKFRIDGTGKGYFDGGTQTGGADFAESVAVKGNRSLYAAGDVLAIDSTGERRLALSTGQYSTRVAGVYSTKPGVLASLHPMDEARLAAEAPLAVIGIVPCKVTAENGVIRAGDLLVSSSRPGYAMKGTDRGRMLGAVIGKAMGSLDEGAGVIEVLLTLQ